MLVLACCLLSQCCQAMLEAVLLGCQASIRLLDCGGRACIAGSPRGLRQCSSKQWKDAEQIICCKCMMAFAAFVLVPAAGLHEVVSEGHLMPALWTAEETGLMPIFSPEPWGFGAVGLSCSCSTRRQVQDEFWVLYFNGPCSTGRCFCS